MGSESWLEMPRGSHLSLANVPFGIVTTPPSTEKYAVIAISDRVLDLHAFAGLKEFTAAHSAVFFQPTMNDFATVGQPFHQEVRKYLQKVLAVDTSFPEVLKNNFETQRAVFLRRDEV